MFRPQNYGLPLRHVPLAPCGLHPIGYCTTACVAVHPNLSGLNRYDFNSHFRGRNHRTGDRSCSCYLCRSCNRHCTSGNGSCQSPDHFQCEALRSDTAIIRVALVKDDLYHTESASEIIIGLDWTIMDLYRALEEMMGCDVEVLVEIKDGSKWELRDCDIKDLFWGVKRGDVVGLTLIRRLQLNHRLIG